MLTLSEISKSFGARTLFEEVSLSINFGERIALVGANGAGKSTLFSIILGTGEPDSGSVVLDKYTTLGYLPQETAATGDETVLQLATAITPEHGELMRILAEGARTGQTDTEEYHNAQGRFGAGRVSAGAEGEANPERAGVSRERFRPGGEDDERRLDHARAPGAATGDGAGPADARRA